jgi:hypothetical protein
MAFGLLEEIERMRRGGGAPASTMGIWSPQRAPMTQPAMANAGGGDMAALASLAPILFGGSSSTTTTSAPKAAPAASPAPQGGSAPNGGGFFSNVGRSLANIDPQTWFEIIGGFADPDSYVGAGARGISQAMNNQRTRRQEREDRTKTERAVQGAIESGSTGADAFDPALIEMAKNLPAAQAIELLTEAMSQREATMAKRAQADYVSPYRRQRDKIEDERAAREEARAERGLRVRERSESRAATNSARTRVRPSNPLGDEWEAF